jgi:hypothetical protein
LHGATNLPIDSNYEFNLSGSNSGYESESAENVSSDESHQIPVKPVVILSDKLKEEIFDLDHIELNPDYVAANR